MSKHTPGPWEVFEDGGYWDIRSPLRTWAVVGSEGIDDEANARLIAAAPELLEALKECAAQLEIHMVHTEDLIAHMKAVSAIAKATGESE